MKGLWLSAIVVLIADQLTKRFVLHSFFPNESRVAIPHVLWWTYVQNTHGAFGLFGDSAILLIVMALVVLGVFWIAFRDSARQSLTVRVAFGAIVGGAIGNIIDRIHYHFVVDFIDLRWWPVFNIADSCISIGVIALVLVSLRSESIRRHAGG
ncbi:MAG: signal peptidase II [Candidatus Eremiobacteraeota bacterium]|nr:signal peptidase II [Candidatus Eremiobacteraeota bacterium]